MPSTTTDRQDLQLSVAQRLQTIYDMPAADCSSDAPAPPNPSSSSSSSSSQESFFTQVWVTQQELQQLASSQPHSNAACGTTALRRCCIATWHPEQTLPYEWWQPAATLQASDLLQAAAASSGYPSASSSAAKHVHSSRSSVAGVDVVSGDGSSQRCFLLDPLCSGGVLLEASQDFAGAGAAAALAAERDEAYVAMRAMQYEHWQQRQEYQHQLALLSRCIRQLEQQQDEQAGTPASRTLSRKTTSSRSSSQHSHSSSSSSSSSRSKVTSRRCTVQFSIACPTEFGQRLWLVGDAAALGSWDVVHGLRLKWVDGGKWVGSVDLDADCTAAIRYKAVLQCGPGQYRWAAGDNHELLLTAGSHSVEHEFA
uniref:CBM20 domain-containing protein n=1 Tax=Tetradesmus obliquus TaxID=3088 RepID=A0A383W7M3_TETOB|eukprot:jgi/Sobl393_1/15708/SZX73119.1